MKRELVALMAAVIFAMRYSGVLQPNREADYKASVDDAVKIWGEVQNRNL